MTLHEIMDLAESSVLGAFIVKLFDVEPFLVYEIRVDRIKKKEKLTRVAFTGFFEKGWEKKKVKLYQIEAIEQADIKFLLELIAGKDQDIFRMSLTAEKVITELKQITFFA